MAIGLLFVVLCFGAAFNHISAALNDTSDTDLDSTFGYELIMAALEDFQLRTQEDIQDSKNYTQEVNSNVENVQNSVSKNKQMLEDQKKNIDGLGKTISLLLDDKRIQQVIEQNSQMVISNVENVQKSVSNNERMLADQRKNIDGLEHKFSQLLNDTRIQQVIEQNSQMMISNVKDVQKSVSNNERMLADQKMNIERLGYNISQLLDDKRILQVIQDSKRNAQQIENLQLNVANNRQILMYQTKTIEELSQKISRLLKDTSKVVESQRVQQTQLAFSGYILLHQPYQKKFLETCRDATGTWSGVRILQPQNSAPFVAYCDQEYEGGGWTVIQNRFDGGVNFYRGWKDYEKGFGDLEGELWLGLKNLHHLTHARQHELHVVMEDFEGNRVVAKYSHLLIGGAKEKYALSQLGTFSGDAGDSLSYSLNMSFSTFDSDNDSGTDRNCAEDFSGAWWYNSCHASNLNGLYLQGKIESYANMMCWQTFKGFHYGLKSSRMMIRAEEKSFWSLF